ncbi:MAG: Uma2 family endonuclease [Sphingomonas sp.]
MKLVDYGRAGVANYWVVDAVARVVQIMRRPGTDGYGEREVVRFGDALPVPCTDATITID